jgi:hypothetical protein
MLDCALERDSMRKFIALFAWVLFLAGCASASSMMLSDDTALISAEGKGPRDRDKVVRDALVEAARVTSANGFRYFVVLTADDLTSTLTVVIPGRVLHNQPPRANGSFGAFTGAYATGGSTYTTPERKVERIHPAMDIIIHMYREGEIEPQTDGVFDATAALQQ